MIYNQDNKATQKPSKIEIACLGLYLQFAKLGKTRMVFCDVDKLKSGKTNDNLIFRKSEIFHSIDEIICFLMRLKIINNEQIPIFFVYRFRVNLQ